LASESLQWVDYASVSDLEVGVTASSQ